MVKNSPLCKAIELIDNGHNVFITGGGGVGKSYILKKLKEHYGEKLNITGTTGISAVNVEGQTIHSWAGIGKVDKPLKYTLKKIRGTKSTEKSIIDCELLAIDEISMLSDKVIMYLDEVLKEIRENCEPFGGLQVIFIGDFFQLPPVSFDFCFKAPIWKDLNLTTIYLKEVKRQSDKKYIDALNNVRTGNVSKSDCKLFESRNYPESFEFDNNILQIYAKNYKANRHNNKCFNNLNKKTYVYEANDTLYRYEERSFKCSEVIQINDNNLSELTSKEQNILKNFNNPDKYKISEKLELKEGCRVMLLKNLNVDTGLVNGACGTVTKLTNDLVEVLFDNQVKTSVKPAKFEYIQGGRTIIKRMQYPLILAYAVSIHKSQGMTFDKLVVDFADVFECGMGYVALSRTRNLEGLFIKGFAPELIEANKDVVKFYENLENDKNCYIFGENSKSSKKNNDYKEDYLNEFFQEPEREETKNETSEDVEGAELSDIMEKLLDIAAEKVSDIIKETLENTAIEEGVSWEEKEAEICEQGQELLNNVMGVLEEIVADTSMVLNGHRVIVNNSVPSKSENYNYNKTDNETKSTIEYNDKDKAMDDLVKIVEDTSNQYATLVEKYNKTLTELQAYKLAEEFGATVEECADMLQDYDYEDIREEFIKVINENNSECNDEGNSELNDNLEAAKNCILDGNYDAAIDICKRIIDTYDNVAYAHLYLGVAYYHLGSLFASEIEYKKAIDIDNNFAKAYDNLGSVMYQKQKYHLAIKYYEKALECDNSLISAQENIDMVQRDLEYYSDDNSDEEIYTGK